MADLDALRSAWSLDFVRVRDLLTALAAGPWRTLAELVEACGLPRRDVEEILRELEPSLERSDLRLRLRADARPALTARAPEPPEAESLEATMAGHAGARGRPQARYDHVPATPETMARRALWLAETFELAGARVLCLGDHDLTSVALSLVAPDTAVAAVDVDDDVLAHLAAASEGTPGLTTVWGDLRLGLPPSLAGGFDLVFTDPPYTPEGIRLFAERGLEALRRSGHERLVFCYGQGDRHLVRLVEVQQVLSDLRLAVEAVLPGFNRYRGAEALGSRSSLYVCRPTTWTWTRKRRPVPVDPRIYSRGEQALESAPPATPGQTGAGAVAPADYYRRQILWITNPGGRPAPFPADVHLDLGPHRGPFAVRAVLLAGPQGISVTGSEPDLAPLLEEGSALGRLLRSAFDVARREHGVAVTRHDRPPATTADALLRHVALHPGAKVGNALRDALTALTGVTRNEARRSLHLEGAPWAGLRTWELPLVAFDAVDAAAQGASG